jgi:hypothetical protein
MITFFLLSQIPKAIKSVEKDIEEANINRCVLAVSNFLGGKIRLG